MAIYCIGDIHGKFDQLAKKLRQLPPHTNLICVGDIGLGFEDSLEPDCLSGVNDVAAEMNSYVWMIRGNHDNPYFFRGHQDKWNSALSNIKLMGDVDSLDIEGHHVIFVGGAISVDRSHEGRVEGLSWWSQEPVHESAPSRVYHLVEEFGPADLIVTHAGPITTLPVLDAYDPNIYHYSQSDEKLLEDINTERSLLSDCVQYSRAPMVVYGHYHVDIDYHNSGVDYRCCAELETWEFKGNKSEHLPRIGMVAEEKAKVDTAPITLKAPLVGEKTGAQSVSSVTTEEITSEEVIEKAEELRKTTAYVITGSADQPTITAPTPPPARLPKTSKTPTVKLKAPSEPKPRTPGQ